MVDEKLLKLHGLLLDASFQDRCVTCSFLYKHDPYPDMRHFLYTGFSHEILRELKKRFCIPVVHRSDDGSVFTNYKWMPIVIMGDVSFNYVLTLTF